MHCKIKEGSFSKELEDSLLGVDSSNSSSATFSAANPSATVSLSPSSGRLSSLEKQSVSSTSNSTSSATSKEAVTAEFPSDQEGEGSAPGLMPDGNL